jgi:hypothetical protein
MWTGFTAQECELLRIRYASLLRADPTTPYAVPYLCTTNDCNGAVGTSLGGGSGGSGAVGGGSAVGGAAGGCSSGAARGGGGGGSVAAAAAAAAAAASLAALALA